MSTKQSIRNLYLASGLLLLANVLGGLLIMPIWLQLLINTCACVYIGCLMSSRLAKNSKGEIQSYSKDLQQNQSVISMSQAKQFPIVASCFLFGFYLLYKNLPKQVFMNIINGYFFLTTLLSLSGLFSEVITFPQSLSKISFSINIPGFLQGLLEMKKFQLSKARIICMFIVVFPISYYFMTKHWILNNIFGILFSIVGLKSLNLSSTKTGMFLLWALFFYDIFWVYGTDVMITVAKNLDLPIKILFPYKNSEGDFKTSMVGLGDIVIPGIFLSLCLKFDIDKAFKQNKVIKSYFDIKLNYFGLAFAGYFYGIVQTFLVMFIFEHPQPALLFLVPMCTIPVLLRSIFRGELLQFWNYDTQLKMQQQNQVKNEKKD